MGICGEVAWEPIAKGAPTMNGAVPNGVAMLPAGAGSGPCGGRRQALIKADTHRTTEANQRPQGKPKPNSNFSGANLIGARD